jgi:hypothetical protein
MVLSDPDKVLAKDRQTPAEKLAAVRPPTAA